MKLTDIEKRMLDGGQGPARQKAMELMVRYGDILGAEVMCRITWADLFCGSHQYLSVVKSDDFDTVFSRMSLCSKEAVHLEAMDPECICYSGIEADCTERPDEMLMEENRKKQNLDFLSRFVDAGVVLSGNCIPYLTGFMPLMGEHFVSCESSAVLFMNALWGACGNGDGIEASFCAAVCGRTPLAGMHLAENRTGSHIIDIQTAPESIHDWDLLGYAIGSQLPPHAIPVLTGDFARPTAIALKSFFASLACSAGTEMCHIVGLTPEAPSIETALAGKMPAGRFAVTRKGTDNCIRNLNPNRARKIDYITLGCPHYHIDEIRKIADFLSDRQIHPDTRVDIWTTGPFRYMADRCGYTEKIERAGARLVTGSCPSTRGYPQGVQTVAYDSAKQRHSAEQETDALKFYGSRQTCLASAVSGYWEGVS